MRNAADVAVGIMLVLIGLYLISTGARKVGI